MESLKKFWKKQPTKESRRDVASDESTRTTQPSAVTTGNTDTDNEMLSQFSNNLDKSSKDKVSEAHFPMTPNHTSSATVSERPAKFDSDKIVQETIALVNDDTTDFKRLTRQLLTGKPLELEEIAMCREKIILMSESVCSLERIVEEVKWCLSASLDSLSSDCGGAYFLQLVIKSIDVWDCGQSSFKRKLILTNGELVKKTHELEKAINTVMVLFLQRQKDLKILDHALKIHPEIVKFRERVPFQVKKGQQSPNVPLDVEQDDSDNSEEQLVIKFVDSEMQFHIVKVDNGKTLAPLQTQTPVLLNDLTDDCQAEIICVPIRQPIRSITKAIYNIRMAQGHLESLRICELWEIIIPPSIKTPFFNSLENVVLAILVNSATGSVYTIQPLLIELESSIGHVNWIVRLLQFQLQGKRLIDRKKGSKITLDEVLGLDAIQDALKHDKIPDEFAICSQPITREYTRIIDKGLRTPETQSSLQKFMNTLIKT